MSVAEMFTSLGKSANSGLVTMFCVGRLKMSKADEVYGDRVEG